MGQPSNMPDLSALSCSCYLFRQKAARVPCFRLLQPNAHFRDNSCRFRHPWTPFLTTLAPCRLRDREPQVLGTRCPMSQILLPPPSHPATLSFTTFAGPKYCGPKMASHDLRAGSAKHGCLIAWTSSTTNMGALPTFPLPASLFPTVARQSATKLLT